MTQLLTPPTGDPRTPEEYTYDMQRSGTLYSAQPSDPMTKIFEMIEDEPLSDALLAEGHHNIPIGTIDGAPVLGSYMENGKLYTAKVQWQGYKISTDGDTYLNLGLDSEHGCVGDMSLPEWEMSKTMARVGIVEQLLDLARQHRYYAGQPVVVMTKKDYDWFQYDCGGVSLAIEDGGPSCFCGLGIIHDIDGDSDMQELRDLYTLLSDPRVQGWLGVATHVEPVACILKEIDDGE